MFWIYSGINSEYEIVCVFIHIYTNTHTNTYAQIIIYIFDILVGTGIIVDIYCIYIEVGDEGTM